MGAAAKLGLPSRTLESKKHARGDVVETWGSPGPLKHHLSKKKL